MESVRLLRNDAWISPIHRVQRSPKSACSCPHPAKWRNALLRDATHGGFARRFIEKLSNLTPVVLSGLTGNGTGRCIQSITIISSISCSDLRAPCVLLGRGSHVPVSDPNIMMLRMHSYGRQHEKMHKLFRSKSSLSCDGVHDYKLSSTFPKTLIELLLSFSRPDARFDEVLRLQEQA